jgi:outer membrane protein TolC
MIKVKLVGYKKRISTFIVVVLLSACSHNPTSESSAKDDFAVELKELPWQSAERSASEASLESKVYDWHATRLTLTAAVAGTWFEWLMLDEQLDNARWYLRAAEKQFNFIQAAYNSGGATHIELAQQRKQVLSRSSNIKKLTHQKNQARNALAILLGEVPQNFNPPKIKLMSL